jgi:hypothetical protein
LKEDMEWLANSGPKPQYEWEAATCAGAMALVVPGGVKDVRVDSRQSGYTGNEYNASGETLSVYFQAALIVHLAKKP